MGARQTPTGRCAVKRCPTILPPSARGINADALDYIPSCRHYDRGNVAMHPPVAGPMNSDEACRHVNELGLFHEASSATSEHFRIINLQFLATE